MQPHGAASTSGRASVDESARLRSQLDTLRTTCRQQARTIDALGEAIAVLRTGASALKSENADLRAAGQRALLDEDTELTEIRLELDAEAPAAARAIVTGRLRERLPGALLDTARLLTSELVTNSVLHSDAPRDAVVVFRLEITHGAVRLEVEDPGCRGEVAPRQPDPDRGGGFGLFLVHQLSERWGIERFAAGGTRVWAQIALAAPQLSTA